MKNILFDLDGTLVDSSKGIIESFQYAFNSLSYPQPSIEIIRTYIGPPLETTFQNYFTESKDLDDAILAFRDNYKKSGVHQVSLYEGVKTSLRELSMKGYSLYVTTSKFQPMAYQMLENLQIADYFDGIYGSINNRFHKVDVINACLEENQLKKESTVIIGDTKFDMIGGNDANIHTIGVTWGFGSQTDLLNAGAEKICHHPKDIEKSLIY
ncbi:hypothetical protein HMPREF9318_00894 [Streptococcus urinalis FB127-CNA-2]|uniref:NLI interacting factor-like phosphatase n=1 Tax=Streptococcus urinalis 2285-97 TaxID=764291 RepID=G5KGM8_9STRE|nr:HAD hydrolase-like protein [Streptococcus urinalis]EHJ57415.1 NLI interacting factor-like phosphatase [Streptococcus urinalis 2285-97]EKS20940.1 hypothetical protein HMPREF9318_00894 [Streptococcus urinalis FB127-CNA-2]VEF30949.1 phosphoglycolate phosphatase [Streptococcus urinalis]